MKKIFSFVFIFLFLVPQVLFAQSFFNTPTVLEINADFHNYNDYFLHGRTDKQTKVDVYLDGQFWGEAQIKSVNPSFDDFYFNPSKLPKNGLHKLFVIARGKNILLSSGPSPEFSFVVSDRLEAPKLLSVNTTNNKISLTLMGIKGVYVLVYLDNAFVGKTLITELNNKQQFTYSFSKSLTNGEHFVRATFIDNMGRTSEESNILKFNFSKPIIKQSTPVVPTPQNILPQVSNQAVEEKADTTDSDNNIKVKGIEKTTEQEEQIPDNKIDETTESQDETVSTKELLDILNPKKQDEQQSGSSSSETNTKSNFNINLIVFLLFLVATILWIIWVNKELIKEKDNEKSEKKKNE